MTVVLVLWSQIVFQFLRKQLFVNGVFSDFYLPQLVFYF